MVRYTTTAIAGLVLMFAAESGAQTELTRDGDWQFRALRGGDGLGWKPTLEAALESLDLPEPAARRPRKWVTFVPWDPEATRRADDDHPAKIAEMPSSLTLGGVSASRATLPLYPPGVLDLTVGQGAPRAGRWAYAFGQIKAARDAEATLALRADGPLTVWLDGKIILETDKPGVRGVPVRLTRGRHLLAAWVVCGQRRWWFGVDVLPPGPEPRVEARCRFKASGPGTLASLTFAGPPTDEVRLNGRRIERPLKGMVIGPIRGIPASLLADGRNELTVSLSLPQARDAIKNKATMALTALEPTDGEIALGPVAGLAPKGTIRIAAVANIRAPATLSIAGRELTSPAGVVHAWTIEDLEPGAEHRYEIRLGRGPGRRFTLRTPPADGEEITVAIVGDPQSGKAWGPVSRAVAEAKPDVLIIAGDMVVDGLNDPQWERTFFAPAGDLLATVPTLAVPGNHDRYSPLFDLFFSARDEGNWTRRLGGAGVVGIDGGLDWSKGSPHLRWLDRTLAGAAGRLRFVVSHYPAYSSRNHGKLAPDGRVLEWTSRVARRRLVPVLERRGVAALFGGHDHGYERSELSPGSPGGLTAIVTGGAGAGTYPKRDSAERQNPHSASFAAMHHFCLLRLRGGTAALRVLSPAGKQIDKRTWTSQPETEN